MKLPRISGPHVVGIVGIALGVPASLFLAACAKKVEVAAPAPAAVEIVQQSERSQHFDPVNSHLELGGTLYGYVDVDGDILDLAKSIQAATRNIAASQPQIAALAKPDFNVIAQELGLTDVKAVGFSSVHQANGLYRNRAFLYTPEGRHGILAIFGGKPAPFVSTSLAPADTDFYAEHEFDVVAVFNTLKIVIAKVAGPEAATKFEDEVKAAGSHQHFSLLDLIEGLQGRATIIMRLDPDKTVTIPGANPITLPETSVLVRVDGIGPAVESLFADPTLNLEASTEGDLHLYTAKGKAPFPDFKYVLAVQGKQLYFATSAEFLHACLKRSDGLNTNPAFVAALATLGPDGNGLTWVTPRFFSRFKDVAAANAQSNPKLKNFIEIYSANLPTINEPLLSMRTNLDDGILLRSTWNRSLKADIAMLSVYNPVTVGLLAAMAIPAFQKVRTNSQAMAITNNLRQLSAAADQYYLEKGVATATYDDLVGPDKYVKQVTPVAGEDYHSIIFVQKRPLTVHLPDGRSFSYPYGQPRTHNLNRVQGPQTNSNFNNLNFNTPAPAFDVPGAAKP